ncbi:MAG: radical SAM protein [Vulcanimicrobiota bacterium]
MTRPRLLLIQPRSAETFWTLSWVYRHIWTERAYGVAPLGVASVAALTPAHWDITIVDESVEELDLNFSADVVGVAGMSNQVARQNELLRHFRERGCYVVAGGPSASLVPEIYEGIAQTVIVGEAEYTWPRFCRDFEQGTPEPRYQETGDVSMEDVPCPRFDLLKLDRYAITALQFSRGCPFRCEFCDIIVMFGRKPRTKSLAQVEKELDAVRAAGSRNIFFVDDNLIGHKPRCKELLKGLVEYQKRHRYRFFFGSEASLNLAGDATLLALFREAGFGWLFLGLESPSEEALRETKKLQNVVDMLASVRRIHAHGIHVQAGFIIGFDSDDETIFERQFRFIQESGITLPMVGLLHAIPKTPLWERLERAGRLRLLTPETSSSDNTGPSTNLEPLKMSYRRLVTGYAELIRALFDDRAIAERTSRKIRDIQKPLPAFYVPARELPFLLTRFFFKGLLAGGPRRLYYFLRNIAETRLNYARMEATVDSWINSLALQDFVRRRF